MDLEASHIFYQNIGKDLQNYLNQGHDVDLDHAKEHGETHFLAISKETKKVLSRYEKFLKDYSEVSEVTMKMEELLNHIK
jgi:hypothetical protein